MTILTAPDGSRSSRAMDVGFGLARLQRDGREEAVYVIDGGRWTVGSSPRCRIRLPDVDVPPLQCLITADADGARATRWAPGVLVNGREFAEQALAAGDRIEIGSWQLIWDDPKCNGSAPTSLAPTATRQQVRESAASGPPACRSEDCQNGQSPEVASLPEDVLGLTPKASKTILVASRKTDLCCSPLGPRLASSGSNQVQDSTSPRVTAHPSHAFQDRLVVCLWESTYIARRRLRAALAKVRDVQHRSAESLVRISELSSLLAAENELHLRAREEFDEQLAGCRKQLLEVGQQRDEAVAAGEALRISAEEDLKQASAEIALLRAELGAVGAERNRYADERQAAIEASSQVGDEDAAIQELMERCTAAEQSAQELMQLLTIAESRITTLQEQRQVAEFAQVELEQRLAREVQGGPSAEFPQRSASHTCSESESSNAEVERLRKELTLCHQQLEAVQEALAVSEAARIAAENAWAQSVGQAQADSLGEDQGVAQGAPPINAGADDHWSNPVESNLQSTSGDGDESTLPTQISRENESNPLDASMWRDGTSESDADGHAVVEHRRYERDGDSTDAGFMEREPGFEPNDTTASDRLQRSNEEVMESLLEPTTPKSHEAIDAPVSFIDRYRHMLEDDQPKEEPSRCASRSLLDEEFLSPSAVEAVPRVGEEEPDEALEAYMSNLMSRVRAGSAATFGPGSLTECLATSPPAVEKYEPVELPREPAEIDANGMLRTVRKQPLVADWAALRELANSSARTAIAHHRQRRHWEKTLSRGLVCAAASLTSGYLVLTAPSPWSPWFWSGCVAMLVAGGAGTQLLAQAWRRVNEAPRRMSESSQTDGRSDCTSAPSIDQAS